MNKNRIRLTESQLHRVIKESVKSVLNEHEIGYNQHHHDIIHDILKTSGLDDALYNLKHYSVDNRRTVYGKVCATIYYRLRNALEEITAECNHSKSDPDVHAERVKAYNEFLDANPNWKKQFSDGEEMANQPLTISHMRYR